MVNSAKVLAKVLKKIKPSKKEQNKLSSLSQKTLKLIESKAKRYNAKAILAGSITRHTWLPGKREFDVFVLFPPDLPETKLEEYGLQLGKEVINELRGKFSVEYAQHPYASGNVNGIDIDIVPCYAVESAEKIKSAVDRTPFHVRYMEKNLPLSLSDDVRLLKQFLTSNGLYGADAKTEGFSGYVCELLTIRYNGFAEVLKKVSAWNPGEIIDLENYYKKEEHVQLKNKFKNNPLILIDPTDKNRNTASALSIVNFIKFTKLAKDFLKNSNEKFFFAKKEKRITNAELNRYMKQRKTELIFIKFTPPKVVPDIFWPQLRRFAQRLQNILEETKYEFKVLRNGVFSNEKNLAIVLLEMEVSELPYIQKRIGPSVFDVKDAQRFLEKYKSPITGPFVEDDKWVVEIKRKFVSAENKLRDSLKDKKEILEAKGIPNYIAEQLTKGFEILTNEEIGKIVRKDENFGIFLKKYFEKQALV